MIDIHSEHMLKMVIVKLNKKYRDQFLGFKNFM